MIAIPDDALSASISPDVSVLSQQQMERYEREGYVIVRGLWTPLEVAACRDRFEALAEVGERIDHHWEPDLETLDPLRRYPRVMHPHRFDALSRSMLLDARIESVLTALLGEEPIATQTMYYFKPPGGKGQALHQDNYYLRVKPRTCLAAWTAIDRSTPDNGGLYLCPGTHTYDLQCPELANPDESFTTDFVRPPAGITPVPAVLEPGDVLFFNGCVVHGSRPNTSTHWRRSFIAHYAPASAREMHETYRPMLRFDGSEHLFDLAQHGGGPCGTQFGPEGFAPFSFEKAKAIGRTPVAAGSIPE